MGILYEKCLFSKIVYLCTDSRKSTHKLPQCLIFFLQNMNTRDVKIGLFECVIAMFQICHTLIFLPQCSIYLKNGPKIRKTWNVPQLKFLALIFFLKQNIWMKKMIRAYCDKRTFRTKSSTDLAYELLWAFKNNIIRNQCSGGKVCKIKKAKDSQIV